MQVFAIQSKTPPHWLAKSLAAAPRHRVSAPLQSRSVLSVLPAYLPATSCVLPDPFLAYVASLRHSSLCPLPPPDRSPPAQIRIQLLYSFIDLP